GDRSSDRARYVVDLAERARRHDTLILQSLCQVAGLEPLAGPAEKQRPMRRVAAGLRYDVHDEPTCFDLAQLARAGKGDLFGGAGVQHIAGRGIAGGGTPDREAV